MTALYIIFKWTSLPLDCFRRLIKEIQETFLDLSKCFASEWKEEMSYLPSPLNN